MPEQSEEPDRSPSEFELQVAARLTEARRRVGLDQIEAGRQAGLGVNAVGLWERAKRMPSAENLVSICKLYGVSIDWILGLASSPSIEPGHAVVDLALEKQVLEAKTIEDAMAAAKRRGALTSDGGIQIGYKVPKDFGLVPSDAFDDRVAAVVAQLGKLKPQSFWKRPKRSGRRRDEADG